MQRQMRPESESDSESSIIITGFTPASKHNSINYKPMEQPVRIVDAFKLSLEPESHRPPKRPRKLSRSQLPPEKKRILESSVINLCSDTDEDPLVPLSTIPIEENDVPNIVDIQEIHDDLYALTPQNTPPQLLNELPIAHPPPLSVHLTTSSFHRLELQLSALSLRTGHVENTRPCNAFVAERRWEGSDELKPFQDACHREVKKYLSSQGARDKRNFYLKLANRFRKTGEAITKIVQSDMGIVIGSKSKEGHFEHQVSEPHPWNNSGNLITVSFDDGSVHELKHHSSLWCNNSQPTISHLEEDGEDSSLQARRKHYSVSDLAFNPKYPFHFCSAGHDGSLQLWRQAPGGCRWVGSKVFHETAPIMVKFHREEPLLAVGCLNGSLYYSSVNDNLRQPFQALDLTSRERCHTISSIMWGSGPTNHLLFASTNTDTEPASGGHKCFNVSNGQSFQITGDHLWSESMVLTTKGDFLAMATQDNECTRSIWFYDPRAGSKALHQAELKSFCKSEITASAFSPDDLFLALGSKEDTVYVWDVRYINRPYTSLPHSKRKCLADHSRGTLGISRDMYWIEESYRFGPKLGLVTGGSDGCARVWDLQQACTKTEDSDILVQCEYDIGALALGEPGKSQHRLAIGDNSGAVYLYK